MLPENYKTQIKQLAQNIKEFQENENMLEAKNQAFSELFLLITNLETQEEYNILTQNLIENLENANFDFSDFNQNLITQQILKYTKPESLNLVEKKIKEIASLITNRLKSDQESPKIDLSYYEIILEEQNLIAEKLEEIDFLFTQIKEEEIMTSESFVDHLSVIIPTFINISHPKSDKPLFNNLESLVTFNRQAIQETKLNLENIDKDRNLYNLNQNPDLNYINDNKFH